MVLDCMTSKSHDNRSTADGTETATQQVVLGVFAVIAEFHQVIVRDETGQRFAITRHTQGVDWTKLYEGQQLRCTVMLKLPRVLIAEVIDA